MSLNFKLMCISFVVVFLAELGDKTQLAALSLSSDGRGGVLSVFIGASSALICSTALACLCSCFLNKYINPKYLNIGSSVLFIILGVFALVKLAWTSEEFREGAAETQTACCAGAAETPAEASAETPSQPEAK